MNFEQYLIHVEETMDWLEKPRKPARKLVSNEKMERLHIWFFVAYFLIAFIGVTFVAQYYCLPDTPVSAIIFNAFCLVVILFTLMLGALIIGATDKFLPSTLTFHITRRLGISMRVNAEQAQFIAQHIDFHPRLRGICAMRAALNQDGLLTIDDYERIKLAISKIKQHKSAHKAWKAEKEDLEAVRRHFEECGLQDRISSLQQHSALQSSTSDTMQSSTDRRL